MAERVEREVSANRQRFSLSGCGRYGNRMKRPSRFFWFDLVRAFFAHEVKHNQVVSNIVMAKLLAGLTVDDNL